MNFGVHLPLIDFHDEPLSLESLEEYVRAAVRLGYQTLAVNDHLQFSRPWLDGPTSLAAVLAHTGDMRVGTTVSLPVVRGPVALAKALAAIDRLSGGRLFVGVGPGSSPRDYEAVGIDFDERWKRLDESVLMLRALWGEGTDPFGGAFYRSEGLDLRPRPIQQPAPPIWIGSWGSDAGLRRTARLADGWLASGYNTTPAQFQQGLLRLGEFLIEYGKKPELFPNKIATMWLYLTEDTEQADRMIEEVLAPTLKRPVEELSDRLPIGPAEHALGILGAYEEAGVEEVLLWPLADEVRQLEMFGEQVVARMRPSPD